MGFMSVVSGQNIIYLVGIAPTQVKIYYSSAAWIWEVWGELMD